ncbi:hypothetical protein GIB67_032452 [Kingdonia uniflora]|uniref:Uncharacterized protein n=1 Tax=Kingdonia uniflora TaxID=39325 RepID=A0A7J7L7N7_9MAGN|nr:hypothetical protein GIB67_032452 [Kingdonia uniflora]
MTIELLIGGSTLGIGSEGYNCFFGDQIVIKESLLAGTIVECCGRDIGGLADIFLRGTELIRDARGMAALTGVLPPFVPFAQAFAAVITAALTGSLYYMSASPTDPTYVVAPILPSRSGREDLKKLFAAWYERRQMKKIYSPLLEGILALYLGYEWIQTDNLLSPMITHGIYSAVILGHGLWKIHDHRRRLRQRIQQLRLEGRNTNKF